LRTGFILIVDEDRELRESIGHAVRKALHDVEVRVTADGAAALHMVAQDDVRLLVTVEETPTIDGLVIAACGRRQHPDLPVIFLTDRPEQAVTAPLDRLNLERIPRRPRLERVLSLIERMLEPPGFRGELELENFIELVRMLSSSGISGALWVRHAGVTGTIWLELGSVVHAQCEEYKGVEAFHRMLRWRSGRFSFGRQRAPERTISISAPDLLRECARFLDQDRALARGSSPGLHALAAKHFLKGLELVKYRRFDEALNEWEQAARLDLGNRSYREHLDRLREQLTLKQ
jgi:CheY-like chemotaxis protein